MPRTKYKLFCPGLPQTPRRSFKGQSQQQLLLGKGMPQFSKKQYNNDSEKSYGYGYGKYR